jgi:hypothetical protein
LKFFTAIQEQDTEAVRRLLVDHKAELTRARFKPEPQTVQFPPEVERDAYTLLGAYLGSLTGLQFSILTGGDSIAMDILDSTFDQGKTHDRYSVLWCFDFSERLCSSKGESLHMLTFFSMSVTALDIDARFGVGDTFWDVLCG